MSTLIDRLRDPEYEDKDGSLLEEAANRLEQYERALTAIPEWGVYAQWCSSCGQYRPHHSRGCALAAAKRAMEKTLGGTS